MIITELYKIRSDGVKLFRTYSDEKWKIIQNETGILYEEAIDVEGAPYTYSESSVESARYRIIPETITDELAFSKGERGWWKGEVYECLVDNQTWNPEQFAAGWRKRQEVEKY